MTTFVITLSSGLTITKKAEDADVALHRARREGWDAVSVHQVGE